MQADGLIGDALRKSIAVLDSKGLIIDDENLTDNYKREFAWSPDLAEQFNLAGTDRGLLQVCEHFRPTVLIGTSGHRSARYSAIARVSQITRSP